VVSEEESVVRVNQDDLENVTPLDRQHDCDESPARQRRRFDPRAPQVGSEARPAVEPADESAGDVDAPAA
jgi:hypothetical protein